MSKISHEDISEKSAAKILIKIFEGYNTTNSLYNELDYHSDYIRDNLSYLQDIGFVVKREESMMEVFIEEFGDKLKEEIELEAKENTGIEDILLEKMIDDLSEDVNTTRNIRDELDELGFHPWKKRASLPKFKQEKEKEEKDHYGKSNKNTRTRAEYKVNVLCMLGWDMHIGEKINEKVGQRTGKSLHSLEENREKPLDLLFQEKKELENILKEEIEKMNEEDKLKYRIIKRVEENLGNPPFFTYILNKSQYS